MSKMEYFVNAIPTPTKPVNLKFYCPIAKDINCKYYRFTIDQDPIDKRVYLEMGFEDKSEFDVSAFLNPKDAKKLGERLVCLADTCISDSDDIDNGNSAVSRLKNSINANNVSKVKINIIGGYSDTVFDTNFGKLKFTIKYYNSRENMYYRIALISKDRYHKCTEKQVLDKINNKCKKYSNCEFIINTDDNLKDALSSMRDTMVKDGLIEVPDNAIEPMKPKDINLQKIVSDYIKDKKK